MAASEAGHHEADVEAHAAGLDAGDHPALLAPGLGAIAGFGIAAQHRHLGLGTANTHIIGRLLNGGPQDGVGRQAEDVVDALGLAERHHLRTAVVAVAAQGYAGPRPVAADLPQQTPQMPPDFLAGGRLAGPQQHRNRAGGRGVVDVDGQEAALVVVGVEQRQLLAPVHHVHGVVDVERHGRRRLGVAGAVQVDHGPHQPDHLAQGGRVLPARDGRLRAQVPPAVGEAAAGQLEAGIPAQVVEVVGVLVAAGDRQDARPQDVRHRVDDPRRVARVRDQRRETVAEAELALRGGEQHHPAVRGQASAVEGGNQPLTVDRRKAERLDRLVLHGGCGLPPACRGASRHTWPWTQRVAFAPPPARCRAAPLRTGLHRAL
jgi:hypothetical protein